MKKPTVRRALTVATRLIFLFSRPSRAIWDLRTSS